MKFYQRLSGKLLSFCNTRKENTVLNRLHIGHSYLTHSFILGKEETPVCVACNTALSLTIKHMTRCQKVCKSWVKILTVNKIWSNYVVLVLHLESVQKWPKKQWTQYKHLCWSAYGDICNRRRFKLWNRAHENGQRNSGRLLRRLRTCAQYKNKFNFTNLKDH